MLLSLEGGCGDPGSPDHGRRLGDGFSQNDRVFFDCDVGYNLDGSVSRTCQDNGTWSGTQPTCAGQLNTRLVECYLFIYLSGLSLQSVFCECFFTLSFVFFSLNFFAVVRCKMLTAPSNGSVSSNKTEFQTKIIFACDKGFDLVGSKTTTCQSDGQWSTEVPTCQGTHFVVTGLDALIVFAFLFYQLAIFSFP